MEIRVENLHRSFAGVPVLEDISFTIPAGELFVILGASGSGKSVLLRHLNGLERPSAGRVLLDGTAIGLLPEREMRPWRLRVGYVFQYSALFDSMTLFENLTWAVREHTHPSAGALRECAERVLREVGMADLIAGMEHCAVTELSGGRQKRIALARALAVGPKALLHDEPTSGLDPESALHISRLIVQLNRTRGMTTVVVTHDLPLAMAMADRIGVVSKGKLAFLGTARELGETARSEGRGVVGRLLGEGPLPDEASLARFRTALGTDGARGEDRGCE